VIIASDQLLGGDPLPWLVLAVGAALALGTVFALVRGEGDADDGELTRPPLARSVVMIGIGVVAALWALASLIKG
jgi:drug/metabolite transporter (DMT)-like permease